MEQGTIAELRPEVADLFTALVLNPPPPVAKVYDYTPLP